MAQMIVSELKRAGAEHVFVLPGGASTYIVDAFAGTPGITTIPMLHEGSAGVAAESYSQYGGRLGVAVVTSGPGSTNILTAVAAAFTDSTAMIVLAGQVKVADLDGAPRGRQYGFQHLPMTEVAAPITNGCITIRDPGTAAADIQRAVRLATTGRPGPVWVELPLDVQNAIVPDIAPSECPPFDSAALRTTEEIDQFARDVAAALSAARRPAVLVGNGVRIAHAQDSVRSLVRDLGLPALVTWKMIDFLDESDPLLAGRPGALAPWSANIVQQQCDVLVVLGARLDHAQVGYRLENLAPHAAVFRAEIDPDEAGKWIDPRVTTIVADVGEVVAAVRAATADDVVDRSAWTDEVAGLRRLYGVPTAGLEDESALSMYEVSDILSSRIPEGSTVVVGSSGQGIEIFLQAFRVSEGQRAYCSAALGSMGFGLAGSVGAYYASGERPVWCIEGDGSLAMSLHDLTAVGARGLPIRLVLLDNGGYMSIRMSQLRMVDTRLGFDLETHLPIPDLVSLARVSGWTILPASSGRELAEAASLAATMSAPTLIHVRLRHGEVAYPRVTTRVLANGQPVTSALDDMWPGLEDLYPTA